MTRRRAILLWIFIPLLLILAIFTYHFLLEIPWHLAFGWISFLIANLRKMQVSGSSLLSSAVLLLLLITGLQMFLSRAVSHLSPQRWHWRWTCSLVAMVILLFAAGISVVGVAHQVGWMLTGPDRSLKNKFYEHVTGNRNGRQLEAAFVELVEQQGHLPRGALFDDAGRALHSWETLLLPYLESDSSQQPQVRPDQVDLSKPWTDAANVAAFRNRVPTFLNPALGPSMVGDLAASHYAWNSHVLGMRAPLKPADIPDGLSNTLALGEVNTGHRAWGDPVNWRDPALGLHTRPDTFGGGPEDLHTRFLLLDGSTRLINSDIDPEVLKALATPAGNEKQPEF